MTAWLLRRGTGAWVALVLGVSLIKDGAGLYPAWHLELLIARSWRDPLGDPAIHYPDDFRLHSPASAALAGMLGIDSGAGFLLFHLGLALLAIVTPLLMPVVRRSPLTRVLVGLLLIGGPVPPVLLHWVGDYDPLTFIALAVIGLGRNHIVAALACVLLAFNHTPTAAVALVIYALVLVAEHRRAAAGHLAWCAGGALVGYLLVERLMSYWGNPTTEVQLRQFYGTARFIDNGWDHLPLTIFSGLGAGWLLLIDRQVRHRLSAPLLLGVGLVAAVVDAFTVLDSTRILAAVLLPALLVLAARLMADLDDPELLLARLLPVAAVTIVVIVWDGHLVYSGWRSTVHLVGYCLGLEGIPV